MNDPLSGVLNDALDYLQALIRERTPPEEALARLRGLKPKHPHVETELVWEEQDYDGSLHYDLLLRREAEGTVSLSFCPERALPWPLRGVHRLSDRHLVRVNNTSLDVAQAIACIDFIWDEARIVNRLIHVCLIQEALARDPVEVSDAELQQAMNAFRRRHRLDRADDTYRWLERNGMTAAKLEALVADEVKIAKLRERVTAGRVEDYFESHRADFATARVARLHFPDKEGACLTIEQLRSGALDFYEAAERLFLTPGERSAHPPADLFTLLRRRSAPAELAAVFAGAPGDLLGPVRTEEGYAIFRVLSLTPARLDEATRATIKKTLFEEWLEERRRAARIEWYWGNAARTTPAYETPKFGCT
jgi:putative peptide maturation system protein